MMKPNRLFGTDLPGTRVPHRFLPDDVELVCRAREDEIWIRNALWCNAVQL